MGFIGKQPTPVPLTASDITDGIITTDKLAANAVTSAKITDGTIATADIADSAVTSAKASGITSEPFRNIFINGDMSVNQRGTVTGINTNTYTLDRWITEGDDATLTVSQSTDVPTGMGFRTSLKIDVTTANSSVAADEEQKIGQRIEGRMLQNLKYGTSSATTATLSFWVRSTVTGTYAIQFQDDDNDKVQTKTYSISAANTWEKKSVTIAANTSDTLDNDNNRSFRVLWWLTAGSNYTGDASSSGAWTARSSNLDTIAYGHNVNVCASTSDNFYLTGCQFEIGSTASDFEFLPFDVVLNRCQRYLEISEGGDYFYNHTSHEPRRTVDFKVEKRGNPTLIAISTAENCANGVTLYSGNRDEKLTARVAATSAFVTGSGKFFYAKFRADSEI